MQCSGVDAEQIAGVPIDARIGLARSRACSIRRHARTASSLRRRPAAFSALRAMPGPSPDFMLLVMQATLNAALQRRSASTICGRMSPLIACSTRQPSSLCPCASAPRLRTVRRIRPKRHFASFHFCPGIGVRIARIEAANEIFGKIRPRARSHGTPRTGSTGSPRRSPRGPRAEYLHGSYSSTCDRLYLVPAALGSYFTPSIGDGQVSYYRMPSLRIRKWK